LDSNKISIIYMHHYVDIHLKIGNLTPLVSTSKFKEIILKWFGSV